MGSSTLRDLIDKLADEKKLLDIRLRSLRSLKFKVTNGIVELGSLSDPILAEVSAQRKPKMRRGSRGPCMPSHPQCLK